MGCGLNRSRHWSRGQNRRSYWTLLYNIARISRHVKMLRAGKILSVDSVANMLYNNVRDLRRRWHATSQVYLSEKNIRRLERTPTALRKATRQPSYRWQWQTRATRKHAKIAQIRRAYNVVADNTGVHVYSYVWLLLRPNFAKYREILWKFKLIEFKVIQGHRSWYESKTHYVLSW